MLHPFVFLLFGVFKENGTRKGNKLAKFLQQGAIDS
jgi:hypothetical protein